MAAMFLSCPSSHGVKASSGLNEEEIARMVKDAEANAEEDKKKIELVQAKNDADAKLHAMKKALAEHGDKVADEKPKIEAASNPTTPAARWQYRRSAS